MTNGKRASRRRDHLETSGGEGGEPAVRPLVAGAPRYRKFGRIARSIAGLSVGARFGGNSPTRFSARPSIAADGHDAPGSAKLYKFVFRENRNRGSLISSFRDGRGSRFEAVSPRRLQERQNGGCRHEPLDLVGNRQGKSLEFLGKVWKKLGFSLEKFGISLEKLGKVWPRRPCGRRAWGGYSAAFTAGLLGCLVQLRGSCA